MLNLYFLGLLGGRAPCPEHHDEDLVDIPEGDLCLKPCLLRVTEHRDPTWLLLRPGVNILLLNNLKMKCKIDLMSLQIIHPCLKWPDQH